MEQHDDSNKQSPQPSQSSVSAQLVAESVDIENRITNYPQGVLFSPDGLCLLTTTVEDHRLRLYNTPTISPSPPSSQPQQLCNDDLSNPLQLQSLTSVLSCPNGDVVRSYAWYPHMNSSNPASCCFVATCRDQPIHLWDAYTGLVRATYRPFNALDEMESPSVVTFSPDGQRILASGFRTDRTIHCFDTALPGRDSTIFRLGQTRRSRDGQKGIVSAMAFSSTPTLRSSHQHVLAVGTYAPGSIYVYDDRSGTSPTGVIWTGLCVVGHGASFARKMKRNQPPSQQTQSSSRVKRRSNPMNTNRKRDDDDDDDDDEEEHQVDDEPLVPLDSNLFSAAKRQWYQTRARRGITQLTFSTDSSWTLYSASRQSDAVLAWDLRVLSGQDDYATMPVGGWTSFATDAHTNQRLQFDLTTTTNSSNGDDDQPENLLLVSGRDSCVRMYQTKTGAMCGRIDVKDQAVVNGVSCTTLGNRRLAAVTTGSRRFPSDDDLELDSIPLNGSSATASATGSLQIYQQNGK